MPTHILPMLIDLRRSRCTRKVGEGEEEYVFGCFKFLASIYLIESYAKLIMLFLAPWHISLAAFQNIR